SRDDDDDPNAPGGGSCLPRIEQALILLDELAFVSSLRDLLGPAAIEGRLAPDVYTKTFARKGYVANTSVVSTRLARALHAPRARQLPLLPAHGQPPGSRAPRRGGLGRPRRPRGARAAGATSARALRGARERREDPVGRLDPRQPVREGEGSRPVSGVLRRSG